MKVELVRNTENGVALVGDAARLSGFPCGDDGKIIDIMVENDYSSIIEHISFTFRISDISRALWMEILEHRIASHTAKSQRYVSYKDVKYYDPKFSGGKAKEVYDAAVKNCYKAYCELVDMGEPMEKARYILPNASHISAYWTINARSLINFINLRVCVRALPEMREFALEVLRIAREAYPQIFDKVGCRKYQNGNVCPEKRKKCPGVI
ncbi:MAG: FAD-dependent thymidylate synthase [Candidatus Altiarchaeota archaeon]|nr:FAD-dependent thymidylate synthase [Candidatus Altiarchaeota archaeon]